MWVMLSLIQIMALKSVMDVETVAFWSWKVALGNIFYTKYYID